MTENDYTYAVHRAITKRDQIIAREGDQDGERLTSWYLEILIQEQLEQDAAIRQFNGGKCQVFERVKI